jgi:hypothetical protein
VDKSGRTLSPSVKVQIRTIADARGIPHGLMKFAARGSILDEVEKKLKKAAGAVDSASGLTMKYKLKLQGLCEKSPSQNCP